jgi:hypothetical protein
LRFVRSGRNSVVDKTVDRIVVGVKEGERVSDSVK